MAGAGVAVTDAQDIQVRYAARGGLGAVMGSKGIKAIVVDDTDAVQPQVFDEGLLREAGKTLAQAIMADPKTENRHHYGTPAVLMACNELGILPTRNFSAGQFEKAEELSGEHIAEVIKERGGEGRSGTPCVRGCVISCSNVFPDPSGKKTVASIQYENIALLGPNCGIGSVDDIAELNDLCNQVGVCAIETGAAIGVAMEAGVIPFGDAAGAKNLIRQIGKGTYLGRILGNGAVVTGKILGVRRVPAIKGQAIPAYDPRSLKGKWRDLYHLAHGGGPHCRECPGDGEDREPSCNREPGGKLQKTPDQGRHSRYDGALPVYPASFCEEARPFRPLPEGTIWVGLHL